jgi:SagB-type dehydrogenase family enzyme
MRRGIPLVAAALLLWTGPVSPGEVMEIVPLPEPRRVGETSLAEALRGRHSMRDYRRNALAIDAVAQILWAAQGVNAADGGRTAPSAGGLYPLELLLVVGEVDGLPAGVYRYRPRQHDLQLHADGDRREALAGAAVDQKWIGKAPAVLVIAAVFERTTDEYGRRGRRYVHMEAGIAAENAHLMVTALGLGTTMVGAFEDKDVRRILELPAGFEPLLLMPVGHIR